MSALSSRLATMIAGRVWVVLVVVVIIAVPTIILGEIAADDTRQRLREAQLRAQSVAVERAATRVTVILASYARELVEAVALRRGADAPIVTAARAGDLDGVRAALADIATHLPYSGDVYFVDQRGTIAAGFQAGPTFSTQLVAQIQPRAEPLPWADVRGSRLGAVFMPPDALARAFGGPGVYLSELYEPFDREGQRMAYGSATGATRPGSHPGPRVSIGMRILGHDGRLAGALVADTAGIPFVDATFEVGETAAEVYLIDRNGRLVLRRLLVRDPEQYRDLSLTPVVRTVLNGGSVRGEAEDPLGGGARLITSARTPDVSGSAGADLITGWHVISAQPLDVVYADVEAGMAVLRAIRVALVGVILALAVLLTGAIRRMSRQRRALAEANESLERASAQIQAATKHKSEFLANMSHELRTPLNAIIGFADVLHQRMAGDMSDKQSEYVEDIATSGRHLLDLVNEILDLSKVEAGRMELEKSEFDLNDTIRAALAFVRERAARHGIEIAADIPRDLGTLTADERKVRQVLLNLLSNAVKFTSDGGWIGVNAQRTDGEVRISVRDTGIGIAPEDQAQVFEEFRQAGRPSDRSREGTGLGLTLAKRFVELHGGRIWVESEVGKGSTFTFAIPVRQTAADALTRA